METNHLQIKPATINQTAVLMSEAGVNSGETNGTLHVWMKKVGHCHRPPTRRRHYLLFEEKRINNFWGRHAALCHQRTDGCLSAPVTPHRYLPHRFSSGPQSSRLQEAADGDVAAGMCVWEGANAKSLKYPSLHPHPSLSCARLAACALWSVLCWGRCTEAHKYLMPGSFFTARGEGQRFTGKTRTFLGIGDNLVRFRNFNVSTCSCEDSMTESLIFKGQLLGKGFPCFLGFLRSKTFWNDEWRDGLMGFGVWGYYRGRENHPRPLSCHLFLL